MHSPSGHGLCQLCQQQRQPWHKSPGCPLSWTWRYIVGTSLLPGPSATCQYNWRTRRSPVKIGPNKVRSIKRVPASIVQSLIVYGTVGSSIVPTNHILAKHTCTTIFPPSKQKDTFLKQLPYIYPCTIHLHNHTPNHSHQCRDQPHYKCLNFVLPVSNILESKEMAALQRGDPVIA